MSAKPIIFSAPMVRALLEGTKTQTRRLFPRHAMHKPEPHSITLHGQQFICRWQSGIRHDIPMKIGAGTKLWVKETWRPKDGFSLWDLLIDYPADGGTRHFDDGDIPNPDWTRPKAAARGNVSPLFMPRWASRITLTVTDVRAERLQEISEADAQAEGVRGNSGGPWGCEGLIEDFADLWNSLHSPDTWDSNPWVIAYTFTAQQRNIDRL